MGHRLRSPSRGGRWSISILLITLYLAAVGLTGSGLLHEAVHADEDEAHHECLVTLIGGGQIEPPLPVDVGPADSGILFAGIRPADVFIGFFTSLPFPPNRGPPLARG